MSWLGLPTFTVYDNLTLIYPNPLPLNMSDDLRIQLLEDGIVYVDIDEEVVGPCGHNMNDAYNEWLHCECCEEVMDALVG